MPRIRTTGALLINPKRRRTKRRVGGAALANLLKNPKRRRVRRSRARSRTRRNPIRRSAARRNPIRRRARRRNALVLTNPKRRRNARKGPSRRRNTSHRRRNSRARGYRRNPPRRRRSRRSSVALFVPPRANGRRRRRNGIRRRRNGAFGSVPLVGGLLDTLVGLVPSMFAGAIAVEPSLAVAQFTARYIPRLPTSLLYPLSSGVVALVAHKVLHSKMFGGTNRGQLKRDIVVAIAASGAAVGYYKKRTGQDHTAAKEMGALVMAGYGSPLAGAIMGDAGLGALVMAGTQDFGGFYGGDPGYGNLMAVTPMAQAGAGF